MKKTKTSLYPRCITFSRHLHVLTRSANYYKQALQKKSHCCYFKGQAGTLHQLCSILNCNCFCKTKKTQVKCIELAKRGFRCDSLAQSHCFDELIEMNNQTNGTCDTPCQISIRSLEYINGISIRPIPRIYKMKSQFDPSNI